jgi:hypothetical protein
LDQVSFLFTIYLNSWFNSFFPLKITVDHTSFLMLLYQLTFWRWKVNSPPGSTGFCVNVPKDCLLLSL